MSLQLAELPAALHWPVRNSRSSDWNYLQGALQNASVLREPGELQWPVQAPYWSTEQRTAYGIPFTRFAYLNYPFIPTNSTCGYAILISAASRAFLTVSVVLKYTRLSFEVSAIHTRTNSSTPESASLLTTTL